MDAIITAALLLGGALVIAELTHEPTEAQLVDRYRKGTAEFDAMLDATGKTNAEAAKKIADTNAMLDGILGPSPSPSPVAKKPAEFGPLADSEMAYP